MTKQEIKSEIQKSLDRLPESVLQDVLAFLRQVEGQPMAKVNMASNLRTILEEEQHLLQRLA
ncbi:MAG: hypothetical protein EBR30_30365 [Cytophagia bacterium]|nr:hypothetical protein [Cytophagia bacterium]